MRGKLLQKARGETQINDAGSSADLILVAIRRRNRRCNALPGAEPTKVTIIDLGHSPDRGYNL